MNVASLLANALLIFGSFLIAGIFLKNFILPRLEKLVYVSPYIIDKVAFGRVRRWIFLWFVLLGLLCSSYYIRYKTGLEYSRYAYKAGLVFLSVSFILFFAEVISEFIRSYAKRTSTDIAQVSILEHFAKWLVILLGILILLHSLGIPLGPVLTGFGIGGLAVALALQDTLANFFSGLHLLISKQIKPGDYVKLDSGEEGYVVDITWRNTVIKELPNNFIIIPNSRIAKAIIKNYYVPEKEISVPISVGISYESDLDNAEKVAIEVAKEVMREVKGGVPTFEPFLRYNGFSDFSINFTVILRAQEVVDQYLIKHEYIKRLHKRFKKEGIVIPYPVRTVYLKEEGASEHD